MKQLSFLRVFVVLPGGQKRTSISCYKVIVPLLFVNVIIDFLEKKQFLSIRPFTYTIINAAHH